MHSDLVQQEAPSRQDAGKKPALELFLLSLLSLYLELFVIRWMSCDFNAFAVFTTFPLVTCFVGLGIGYARRSAELFKWAPWALLQFALTVALLKMVGFHTWVFPSTGTFHASQVAAFGQDLWLYVGVFIVFLVLLLLGPFAVEACLGARLGLLFDGFEPIKAYCINIAGSIAGGILFTITAFAGFTPWQTLLPACLLLWPFLPGGRWQPWLKTALLAACVAVSVPDFNDPEVRVTWTPYQRLDVRANLSQPPELAKSQGVVIGANGRFYQYALNLAPANLSDPSLPEQFKGWLQQHSRNYNLPYMLVKPRSVLVLGAGSGNDVAAALRNGVEHVDAVDIDKEILKLGKLNHPEHPYDSKKVTVYCDDARNFLRNCKSRYDLIVFAGLDSLAVTGRGASLRLDNWVYTRESLQDAQQLLNPHGLMYLSFCKCREWLSQRLLSTVEKATGAAPLVVLDTSNPRLQWEIFLAGPLTREPGFALPQDASPFQIERLAQLPAGSRILTDDWPFLYVNPITFDITYMMVVLTILLLSIIAARRILFAPAHPSLWQMFFLGAGFFLLELQSIARLSLLYGCTWLTSSVVINGILVLILLANFIIIRSSGRLNSNVLYALMLAALLTTLCLPINAILGLGTAGKALVTTFTLLPMFIAALIFGTAFNLQKEPAKALGFNLLGAVVGALLEYLSNYTGIRALALIALFLYFCSFICIFRPYARLASRVLSTESS